MAAEITKFPIKDILQIKFSTFSDERGFFQEVFRLSEIEKGSGVKFNVAQVSHARSAKNTLRGIHSAPWNKIIYVVSGKVQAVIVDLRKDSPTYGQHQSFVLDDQNRSAIFVPAGCGNSYLVLSDSADYVYVVDQEWVPNKEIGVKWDDPTLAIKWQLIGEPVVSEKDKNNPLLDKCE
jgi:dTDP-4-dehydrorhamnose 3,5-epimerase